MNSTDLVREIRKQLPSLTANEAADAVTAIFNTIRHEIMTGGDVVIRGFGKFGSRVVNAREYRNPLDGSKIQKPARRMPNFDYAKTLQDEVSAQPLK